MHTLYIYFVKSHVLKKHVCTHFYPALRNLQSANPQKCGLRIQFTNPHSFLNLVGESAICKFAKNADYGFNPQIRKALVRIPQRSFYDVMHHAKHKHTSKSRFYDSFTILIN